MKIVAHDSMRGVANQLMNHLATQPKPFQNAMANIELSIGPASDPEFQTDASALGSPLFIGDAHWGETISTPKLDAMAKANPESVGVLPKFNRQTGKYDLVAIDKKAGFIGDAAPNLLAAQLLSPASVGWLQEQFTKPMIKSNAKEMVSMQTGSDPWAEAISLGLLDFSGFATINNAGAVNNRMSQDVEAISGAMSSAVINISATYRLTVEETERAKSPNAAPWAGRAIALKQRYADYAMDMITNSLIYNGNSATGTVGLLTINGATAWSGIGSSMTTIAAGSSTTKGSDMYALLAGVIASFLTTNQNMTPNVKVAMSPLAMNILGKTAYSAAYNPQSVLKTIQENFMSGENTSGMIANVEFIADPLLAPSTIYNANAYDYLVITAPDVDNGLDDKKQGLIIGAMPLDKFVFPVIPGQYATPYKTIRRYAGLFIPYTPAVAVYSGFGV
jgi:hypothetical protein